MRWLGNVFRKLAKIWRGEVGQLFTGHNNNNNNNGEREQSLAAWLFHTVHDSNSEDQEMHKIMPSCSSMEICLDMCLGWNGKGCNTEILNVELCKSHFAQSLQSLNLERNSAALICWRTDLTGLFLVGFSFNNSFIAGNESHWSLFGFLLHIVQGILWENE